MRWRVSPVSAYSSLVHRSFGALAFLLQRPCLDQPATFVRRRVVEVARPSKFSAARADPNR
eukprot:9037592-Lingulodinium_polyedra.AAC.1